MLEFNDYPGVTDKQKREYKDYAEYGIDLTTYPHVSEKHNDFSVAQIWKKDFERGDDPPAVSLDGGGKRLKGRKSTSRNARTKRRKLTRRRSTH